MTKLKISVVVICHNEEKYIKECLTSLSLQKYNKNFYEVIIVENCSTDRTSQIVYDFIESQKNMILINSSKKGIAVNRNIGLNSANYDYVAYIDADCIAKSDWLFSLDFVFREELGIRKNIAAVGGPNLNPLGSNRFRNSLAIAVSNYWGNHGSAQGTKPKERRYIDHLPTLNVLYDKKKVISSGSFDENQGNVGEDIDLNTRLIWHGYKIVFSPKPIVFHRWRDSFYSWAKAVEGYGKGRAWLMKKNKRYFKLKFLAPLFLLCFAYMACFFPINNVLAYPLIFYLSITFLITLISSIQHKRPQYLFDIFIIYMITHFVYGLGLIHGFLVKRGSDVKNDI